MAQRLGARLSHLQAGLFGLSLALVNGVMFLTAPLSFLLGGALGAATAAIVGAALASRPAILPEAAAGDPLPAGTPSFQIQHRTLPELAKEEAQRRRSGEPPLPPPPPPPLSFAERTGQSRRQAITQWVGMLGFLIIVVGWWNMDGPHGVQLTLVGTAVGTVGFAAHCLSVRCPRCSAAVIWHTFLNRKVSEAHVAAQCQVACPKCGYEPS